MKHRRPTHIPLGTANFLSVFNGIEGGFAIFAGIVLGLSFETADRTLLISTAILGIIVNALNSATVRYSSEHYLDELDGHETRQKLRRYLLPALVEFVSYAAVAAIAIVPLLIVNDLRLALLWMIFSTILILFTAGWYRGRLLARRHALRDALEVATGGAIIMAAGAAAGWLLHTVL